MRRPNLGAAALVAALLLPLAAQAPMAQGLQPALDAGAHARVIVKYRADSDLMKKQALTATGRRSLQTQALGDRLGLALTPGISLTERSHVVLARGLSSRALADRIAAQPDIEYAVVDGRKRIVEVPSDPYYLSKSVTATAGGPAVGQWYLKPPGPPGTAANTAPSAINAQQAWDLTTGTSSIVVADLDTGVRFDHLDLANVLNGWDMVSADSPGVFVSAGDMNDRDSDASDEGDFLTSAEKASNPAFADCPLEPTSTWHGTQTIGLIGATTGNGVGIAGVGRNVTPLGVRVLAKCGGYDSDIIAGMRWAAGMTVDAIPVNTRTARVINMSLGGQGACTQAYIDVMTDLTAAGVVVVASAGNDNGIAVSSPANCPHVIAVGGLRSDGDKNNFSNIGPEVVVSAPGGNCGTAGTSCLYPIMTTTNSGATTPVTGPAGTAYTDGFNPSLGTSFSSPLVAGTVALMLSVNPGLSVDNIRARLQASAATFPTSGTTGPGTAACSPVSTTEQQYCYCTTATCGAGMLDAHAAVLLAFNVESGIAVSTTAPTAGTAVTLTSTSAVPTGQAATYLWTVSSAGSTGAAISGASNAASVLVLPASAGSFTVSLTATGANGVPSTTSQTVTVASAASTGGGSGGGGGGGALGVGWLMMLASAVLALAAVSRYERLRAARAISAPSRASRRR